MVDYKKMYYIMFNAATDAERIACGEAAKILRSAQRECEQLYIEALEKPITLYMVQNSQAVEE